MFFLENPMDSVTRQPVRSSIQPLPRHGRVRQALGTGASCGIAGTWAWHETSNPKIERETR